MCLLVNLFAMFNLKERSFGHGVIVGQSRQLSLGCPLRHHQKCFFSLILSHQLLLRIAKIAEQPVIRIVELT